MGGSASFAHSLAVSSSMPRVVAPTVTEISLQCADGIQMAAQTWSTKVLPSSSATPSPPRRILCLHGWMDNCRSFYHFAPTLLKLLPEATELVALDLPGHGWSSHKSVDGPPMLLAESIFYVAEAVRQLQWVTTTEESSTMTNTPFTLIGHSMGAAISCVYAAAFPEQIHKLILLEGGESLTIAK